MKLAGKPYKNRLLWNLRYWKWILRIYFGKTLSLNTAKKATVILLSYRRVDNIESIARAVLKCHFVEKVIVSNNNPQTQIENWVRVKGSRVILLNQSENKGVRVRWELARQEQAEYVIVIDDDLFISPEQLETLFRHLVQQPEVPHGLFGSTYPRFDAIYRDFSEHYHKETDMEVDVLHQIYAVTRQHIKQYFTYLKEVYTVPNLSINPNRLDDDILISHTGTRKARIHAVGPVLECPTATSSDIALYKEKGFKERRDALYFEVRKIQSHLQSAQNGRKFSESLSHRALLVSVIIPTYNCAQYLSQALDSVFSQDYPAYEVIVVDDGSTDNTCQILEPYMEQIRYIYQENGGPAAARDHGLQLAQGEFIAFLDADDFFLPGRLTEQIEIFDMFLSIGAVNSGHAIINQQGDILSNIESWLWAPILDIKTFLLFTPTTLEAALIRKEWLERIGGFNHQYRQGEDTDLFWRLSLAGCPFMWLPKTTVVNRLHQTSITRNCLQTTQMRELVVNDFFSRSDLSEQIRSLEPDVRYNVLLWNSWSLFHLGFFKETALSLKKMIGYAPSPLNIELVLSWVMLFSDWTSKYGGQREELRQMWPCLKLVVPFDDKQWLMLMPLLEWWVSKDLNKAKAFSELSRLWHYIETVRQHKHCSNISIDLMLDWVVDIWACYYYKKYPQTLQALDRFRRISLQQAVILLKAAIVISPRLVGPKQLDRLWSDLQKNGMVPSSRRHDITALYLTLFGQAVMARQWELAFEGLKKALRAGVHPQALSAWWRFLQTALRYLKQNIRESEQ